MSAILYKNYPVLVVDDESNNLRAYVHSLKDDFQVEGVSSGEEALEKLKTKEYSVIVSDQKMYPMTGVELLTQAREKYPDIVRVIITGFSNFEAAVKAINDADAFKFIFKSGSVAKDLRKVVKEAIDYLWDKDERLRLQKMLMRENRLAALGRFSWYLSHEMNNPLVSVSTFLQLLETQHNDPEFRRNFSQLIQGDIKRIQTIVKGITQFMDGEAVEKSEIKIQDVIAGAVDLFTKTPESRKVQLEVKGETGHTLIANRYLLIQVLLNLLANSSQAMEREEGKIEIITEPEPVILKDREGKENLCIRLVIKDNGHGVAPKIFEHIFDPLVTTHNTGSENRRPGLGLYISQLIIEGHHGFIDVQSKEGAYEKVSQEKTSPS